MSQLLSTLLPPAKEEDNDSNDDGSTKTPSYHSANYRAIVRATT
jgi:hypothetical protein